MNLLFTVLQALPAERRPARVATDAEFCVLVWSPVVAHSTSVSIEAAKPEDGGIDQLTVLFPGFVTFKRGSGVTKKTSVSLHV